MAKIAIDVDGVVINLIGSWLNQFHPEYMMEDIKDWNAYKFVGISKKQMFQEWDILNPKKIWLYPGAVTIIHNLKSLGYEIFFLTCKDRKLNKGMIEHDKWILNYMSLGNFPYIINCEKWKYAFDIIIEDNPGIVNHTDIRHKILLMERPWNKHVVSLVHSTPSWYKIETIIERMIKENGRR